MNHHEVLDVPVGASPEEIERAYRTLSRQDFINKDALNAAYRALIPSVPVVTPPTPPTPHTTPSAASSAPQAPSHNPPRLEVVNDLQAFVRSDGVQRQYGYTPEEEEEAVKPEMPKFPKKTPRGSSGYIAEHNRFYALFDVLAACIAFVALVLSVLNVRYPVMEESATYSTVVPMVVIAAIVLAPVSLILYLVRLSRRPKGDKLSQPKDTLHLCIVSLGFLAFLGFIAALMFM